LLCWQPDNVGEMRGVWGAGGGRVLTERELDRDSAGRLEQTLVESVGEQGSADVVALGAVGAEAGDLGELLMGFNPFGDDGPVQSVCQPDDGGDGFVGAVIDGKAADERPVDFEDVEREAA
jgi:hypothetical protein